MNQTIIETAKEMIRLTTPGHLAPEGVYRYFPAAEVSLQEIVSRNGGKITSSEEADEYRYGEKLYHRQIQNKDGEDLSAWTIWSRPDVDIYLEETLIFKLAADPGREGIEAVFELARELVNTSHEKTMARLKVLDTFVPKGFRGILLGGQKTRDVAVNIYKSGGELSQAVFAPYKGTLAYPETEGQAKEYFSRTRRAATVEAYLAVGELIAKELL